MLAVTENYNLLEVKVMNETYTNGNEYFKDNAKNAVMQVYHGETLENEITPLETQIIKTPLLLRKIIM